MKSIAVKLLKTIFSFYIVVTVLSTFIHIYSDYSQRKKELLKELENIQTTFAPTLANALWDFNIQQTLISAKGIESIEHITGVVVKGEEGAVIYHSEELQPSQLDKMEGLFQAHKLYQKSDEGGATYVGEIILVSDRKFIFERVQFSAVITIANAFLKTILLLFLFLFAFKRYLKEPLDDLSEQAEHIDFSPGSSSKIDLKHSEYTELNILQTSINKLLQRLSFALNDLHDLNHNLEDKVQERTAELKEKNAMLTRAKDETEHANRVKSDFIANISHELRTPLNAIVGFTEVLKKEHGNEENLFKFDAVLASSDALLRIINDILDITKVEQGKLSLHYEPVNILSLLEQAYSSFKIQADQKSIELRLDIPEFFEPCVRCDETRLFQVLNNLLENAMKFTEEGSVTLSLEQSLHDGFTDLKIVVSDTGVGISKEAQEKIFQPFEQVEGQGPKLGGTGLGLAISRKIAHLLGGSLTVESEEGQGASFTLELENLEVNVANAEEQDLSPKVQFKSAEVLIVDDLDINHSVICEMLKNCGLKLHYAHDEEEALYEFERYPIDLVLMDFRLKDSNGIELSKKLKKLRDVPVIALSASAMLNDEEQLRKCCDAYLRKPLSQNTFIKEISRFLEFEEHMGEGKADLELDFSNDDLEEICQEFRLYQPLMTNFIESMTINDVQTIDLSLKELCQRIPLPALLEWRRSFALAYDNFDMLELERLFRESEDFIKKITAMKS